MPEGEKPLEVLHAPTLAGPQLDVAALAGKGVVVNFWSPSCVPCQKEAPALQAVADELAAEGVALVTVMLEGSTPDAEAFVRRAGLKAPVVIGNDLIASRFRVAAYPWTVVFDRRGQAVTAVRGGRNESQFRSLFRQAL